MSLRWRYKAKDDEAEFALHWEKTKFTLTRHVPGLEHTAMELPLELGHALDAAVTKTIITSEAEVIDAKTS